MRSEEDFPVDRFSRIWQRAVSLREGLRVVSPLGRSHGALLRPPPTMVVVLFAETAGHTINYGISPNN